MKSPSKYAYFVVNDSDNLEELKQFITPFGDVASMIRYWGNINFMLIEKVNFSGMSYMWQFWNIIQSGIVAYFFYLFYRKIK